MKHIANVTTKVNAYTVKIGKPETDHWENLDIDERKLLKLVLRELCGRVWTGLIWFMIGSIGLDT